MSATSEAVQGWFGRTSHTTILHLIWQNGWEVGPLVHGRVLFHVGLGSFVGP